MGGLSMRPDEIERRDRVLAGETVVANCRKSKGVRADEDMITWATGQGLLVNITRDGSWGNPYPMSGERERNKVCDAFEIYLAGRPDLLERIAAGELSGKVLLCWCHPKRCHGDHLAELANRRTQ